MKASDLFVQCLENEGVEYVFGVPGEENEDLLLSLSQSKQIEFVICRHEQGAAFMAASYGRLTGKAGVCLSTLGPGALNLVTAIADANLGHMPLVAITGQGGLDRKHKENFQFVNIVDTFAPLTQWNTSIGVAKAIPETVRKAFKVAEMEKPGATHLELPEDVAKQDIDGKPFPKTYVRRPAGDEKAIAQAVTMIKEAHFPLILAGNGCIRTRVSKQLNEFVETLGIPVTHTQMGKGAISDKSTYSLFTTGIHARDYYFCAFEKADLVITLGYDVVEFPPANWNPNKDKKIMHIDFTPSEVDEYYSPHLEVIGDVSSILLQLQQGLKGTKKDVEYFFKLKKIIEQDYQDALQDTGYPMKPQKILHEIRETVNDDDIVIADVGAHKIWTARNYRAYAPNTCLIDNALASMGISLPGAIGAKLVYPDKNIVVVTGDGGVLMNIQELETAHRMKTPFVVIVFNDSLYGLIEWKQFQHQGKTFGIHFTNPDFVKLAESFGANGVKITAPQQFTPALKKALKEKCVTIIDVRVDHKENMRLSEKLEKNVCRIE
jgi:acetolactate synthase I/II/III large subunit